MKVMHIKVKYIFEMEKKITLSFRSFENDVFLINIQATGLDA